MKADCANCPHHACYTRGANCTGVKEEEIRKAYTEEERKIMEAAAYVEGHTTATSAACRKPLNLPNRWATRSSDWPSASVFMKKPGTS